MRSADGVNSHGGLKARVVLNVIFNIIYKKEDCSVPFLFYMLFMIIFCIDVLDGNILLLTKRKMSACGLIYNIRLCGLKRLKPRLRILQKMRALFIGSLRAFIFSRSRLFPPRYLQA